MKRDFIWGSEMLGELQWPVYEVVLDEGPNKRLERKLIEEAKKYYREREMKYDPSKGFTTIEYPIIRLKELRVYAEGVEPKRIYNPLTELHLYEEFCNIDPQNLGKIEHFVQRYGFINNRYAYKRLGSPIQFIHLAFEEVSYIQQRIYLMKDILDAYSKMKSGNYRDLITHEEGGLPAIWETDITGQRGLKFTPADIREDIRKDIKDGMGISTDSRDYVRGSPDYYKRINSFITAYIMQALSPHLECIYVRPQYLEGKLTIGYNAYSLEDVLFFQVFNEIAGGARFRKCSNERCNNIFVITREDRRFCSKGCSARARSKKRGRIMTKERRLQSLVKENPDATWEERLLIWNERYPEMAFGSADEMRDAYQNWS